MAHRRPGLGGAGTPLIAWLWVETQNKYKRPLLLRHSRHGGGGGGGGGPLWVPARRAGGGRRWGMTPPHSRNTVFLSELYKFVRAPKQEGARDPQERAQGRPGARCTRGLMCIDAQRNAHMSIQVQRKHSGLPCAMALRFIRDLLGGHAQPPSPPGSASFLGNLTPALVRQDHTISPCAPHHLSRDMTRPSLPAPNVS